MHLECEIRVSHFSSNRQLSNITASFLFNYFLPFKTLPFHLIVQTISRWSTIGTDVPYQTIDAFIMFLKSWKLLKLFRGKKILFLIYSTMSFVAKMSLAKMSWCTSMLFLLLPAHTTPSATSFVPHCTVGSHLDRRLQTATFSRWKTQKWLASSFTLTTNLNFHIKSTLYYGWSNLRSYIFDQ